MERPRVDEEWLERERNYHSLDLPLPAVLLYFRAGDAVMACFDDECEHWGQETPEPNLIIPLRPDDPASVRQALAVIETLMQVLVLTVRIKTIIEDREKSLDGYREFSRSTGCRLDWPAGAKFGVRMSQCLMSLLTPRAIRAVADGTPACLLLSGS